MKRGFPLFVSLAVMAIQSLFAQDFSVKGTVFDGEMVTILFSALTHIAA